MFQVMLSSVSALPKTSAGHRLPHSIQCLLGISAIMVLGDRGMYLGMFQKALKFLLWIIHRHVLEGGKTDYT